MSKEEIFEIIKENILDIIPELDLSEVTMKDSLKEIGANSVDRADIIMFTMESLNIRIPMVKFGNAANIGDIVDIMYEAKNE
ncbi:MAG: acyl carrier protein [Ruminococcus bromii]|jgi:polyketide biosynthesis acyl carrier protein|uniref:acyl carrier protein n=1 Tax=Ruminococcus sp. YE282 TaxID=3158780 RepID=UPI0008855B96|nr:acyl carrier protein [Ruminococcus bromii]HCB96312.1 acyl carrier protein [Ruminococcus sp.]MCI7212231.1 acyl carrier protein [Ruminococcus bromii]MDD6434684.1 acyl carrier protein [Ruminococcus bromii]MDY4084277.1 acyl carrier protein [Ruminococcus bromii]